MQATLAWFEKWMRKPVARGYKNCLGVHMGSEMSTAVIMEPGDATHKPRVRACQAFSGSNALDQILGWHERLPSSQRGRPNLLLDSTDYQIIVMDAPPVSKPERREAIRWRLRELIDFPAEEAALDCIEIPAPNVGEAATKLLTLVSKREVVGHWMQRFHDAKQPLRSVDIAELALRNVSLLAGQHSAHAYLHVGLQTTRLLMLWQGELCAFRQLDVQAAQWVQADPLERIDLSERLALEIQRSADAFARLYNVADFTNLWVSGAGSTQTLCETLAPLVTIPIRALALEQWVDWSVAEDVFDLPTQVDFTLAVGAALRTEPPQ